MDAEDENLDVSVKAADDLIELGKKQGRQAANAGAPAKSAEVPNVYEFDGQVIEIGLAGLVLHLNDERQIWELKKKLRQMHPVRVSLRL